MYSINNVHVCASVHVREHVCLSACMCVFMLVCLCVNLCTYVTVHCLHGSERSTSGSNYGLIPNTMCMLYTIAIIYACIVRC